MTGRVGSGKSSLLAAITAEMTRLHGQVNFHLTYYIPSMHKLTVYLYLSFIVGVCG